MSIKAKLTFRVWYKPHPRYEGPYQSCLEPGLHGTFETIVKAKTAAENCKRWFNEEKILKELHISVG